jgi:SAM-dependent methyltransferase
VDTVLCTEVLEHVPNPDLVISEVARVLKPGGAFLCTAPFVYPVHDSFDFYRYSPIGVATIAQRHGLEVEEIIPLSGTGLTLAVMFNLYWFEIGFRWTKWLYPIGLLLRPILLLLTLIVNICGWIFERILPSNHLSFNHLTVARQPGQGISTKPFDILNESVKAGAHKLNG